MHKSLVRFGSAKKIGGSVRFGFGKKFLVRSFPSINIHRIAYTIHLIQYDMNSKYTILGITIFQYVPGTYTPGNVHL